MDLSKVKELIELMNRHQLDEVEVETEGARIRLQKGRESIKEVVTAWPAVAPPQPALAAAGAESQPETVVAGPGEILKSPMVGTFYRSPNPTADSFVDVGDRVEEGKVLCIIEAMKVMNEVKAERSGKIEEIFPDNGDSVEFGQPLFRLS